MELLDKSICSRYLNYLKSGDNTSSVLDYDNNILYI